MLVSPGPANKPVWLGRLVVAATSRPARDQDQPGKARKFNAFLVEPRTRTEPLNLSLRRSTDQGTIFAALGYRCRRATLIRAAKGTVAFSG
jgi:hypothetical protein